MADEYRDMTKPYTEEEIQELSDHFKTLPTFDGTHIRISDFPAQIKKMKYKRSPEQIKAYVELWDELLGGKLSLEEHLQWLRALTNPIALLFAMSMLFDKNGDGTIEAQEFERLIGLLKIHAPEIASLQNVSFEDFLSSADKDKDGRVSIQECADWLKAKALGQ